jgi:orotate phosphoribosyltransferase
MVSQLASSVPQEMRAWLDFVYIRKQRKKSGTCQQLEGGSHITTRSSASPLVDALWVDDVNSTGASLQTGIRMLREEYNIRVVAALFLVDRSRDRAEREEPAFDGVRVMAMYDLDDVHSRVQLRASRI